MAEQDNSLEKLSQWKSEYRVYDLDTLVNGKCSFEDKACPEIAINGVVARIHVEQFNFNDFFLNKAKKLQSNEPKKRGRKRKLQEIKLEQPAPQNSSVENTKVENKKKVQKVAADEVVPAKEVDTENRQPRVIKNNSLTPRVQRIKKVETTSNQLEKPAVKSRRKSDLDKPIAKGRLNGSKSINLVKYSSTRIRKPNPKFQGFVVSSEVRYYNNSIENKLVKEVPIKLKGKPPKKMTENVNTDPLETSNDDVVRSFLPVFDESSQCDDGDAVDPLSVIDVQHKENQTNNVQPEVLEGDNIQTSKLPEADLNEVSPPKIQSKNNSEIPAVKSPSSEVTNDVSKVNKQEQQKRSIAVNNDTVVPAKKAKLNDTVELDKVKKMVTYKSKAETKVNGSKATVKQHKTDSTYGLVHAGNASTSKTSKSSDVDFNKLVRSLKSVKLPAANWKIRIVVSKQQTITEVTFTNKEATERCVKFSRTFSGYVISFGKWGVKLLGAPTKISSFNDVSILLDIIHHISPTDPVLEYNKDSNQ